jgi:PhnB protein
VHLRSRVNPVEGHLNTIRLPSANALSSVLVYLNVRPEDGLLYPSQRHPETPEEESSQMKLTTYLNFSGNCAEAFKFYEKNLGGKIGMIMTYDQMPPDPSTQFKPELAKYALHASITIAGTPIMASDVPPDRFEKIRSSYICLSADSSEDAERIFKILSDGGEVYMPMAETFFATKYGILRDKFGVSWMVIHEKPMGPPSN